MPRRRKSVEEHIISGTYRPGRHGPRAVPRLEPEVEPLPEDPPFGPELSAEERKLWRLAHTEGHWLRACDAGLVQVWCTHSAILATARAARKQASADGELEAVTLYDQLIDLHGSLILKVSQALGFTPASRRKLGLGADPRRAIFEPKVLAWPRELLDP